MSSFCKCKSYSHFFSKNISIYAIFNEQSFNDTLTNNIVSFEQLGLNNSSYHFHRSMTVQLPYDESTFSFLDLFPFLPFVLGAISTDNTSRNVNLYTFGKRMPKTTQVETVQKSCSHCAICFHGLCTISMRKLHRHCMISVLSLHGLRMVLPWSDTESLNKKLHGAHIQCKHICRGHLQCLKNRMKIVDK